MVNLRDNLKPVAGSVIIITLLLLFTWLFTKNENIAEVDNTKSKPKISTDEASLILTKVKPTTALDLTNQNKHQSTNVDVDYSPEWTEDYEIDPSKIDRANEVFQNISKLAESKAWEEIIDLAHKILAEGIDLGSTIFLEVAKHDAPNHVFSTLSNLGIKLPYNASEFLIGTSEISTLQTLVDDYELDLNHFHEVKGNAFSYATTSDAPIEVYQFLVKNEATLDNFGRFEPVQELIDQALIPGDKNEIEKIITLLDYGAVLTQKHYDDVLQFKDYRPELFNLIDHYYSNMRNIEDNED